MSFIEPDEHVVMLDYNFLPGREFTPDELAKLRDSGIKTVMGYACWNVIETSKGAYDWSSVDSMVDRYFAAGLKSIVKAYFYAPSFFPDNWYMRRRTGEIQNRAGLIEVGSLGGWSILSYWNKEAWDYHLRFIEAICEHYSSHDVMCINIAPATGEALMPGNDSLFDDCAIESYRKFTGTDGLPSECIPGSITLDWLRATVIPAQIETQRVFQNYCGEYWTQLHHAFETMPSTGNWLIDDLYTELHRELGDEHWGMCYTVFRPGETRGLWGPERDIQRHGVKMLFASEGPAGLLTNTTKAIKMGAMGMLTGPLVPYLGNTRMQPWMYDAIIASNEMW